MQPEGQQQVWLGLAVWAVLAVDAALLLFWAWRRYGAKPPRPAFAARWSLLDLWVGGQAAVVLTALGSLLLLFALMAAPGLRIDPLDMESPRTLVWFALPATLLQNAAFFAVPAAVIHFKYGLPLRAVGLPPAPRGRDVAAGVALGLALTLVAQGAGAGLTALAEHFKDVAPVGHMLAYEKSNPVAAVTRALPAVGVPGLILGALAIGVAAPLGEEVLFRGFALNVLSARLGAGAGLVLSALLFALPHTYSPLGQSVVFGMGLALGWAYRCSGSLWTPIIAHATNNLLLVLVAYFLPHLAV